VKVKYGFVLYLGLSYREFHSFSSRRW
jgi:hypothetical protein